LKTLSASFSPLEYFTKRTSTSKRKDVNMHILLLTEDENEEAKILWTLGGKN